MMLATRNALFEVVKIFVEWGADMTITNKMGHTAAHIAAYNSPERTFEILQFLLDNHLSILTKNSKGENILKITDNMGHESSIYEISRRTARAELWVEKGCVVKMALLRKRNQFKNISMHVFREIIKYA